MTISVSFECRSCSRTTTRYFANDEVDFHSGLCRPCEIENEAIHARSIQRERKRGRKKAERNLWEWFLTCDLNELERVAEFVGEDREIDYVGLDEYVKSSLRSPPYKIFSND